MSARNKTLMLSRRAIEFTGSRKFGRAGCDPNQTARKNVLVFCGVGIAPPLPRMASNFVPGEIRSVVMDASDPGAIIDTPFTTNVRACIEHACDLLR